MVLSPTAVRFLIVIFVALGSLTYGYCSSIIATTLGQPSFIAYFDLDTRSNATDLTGAINGLFQAGGLLGALSIIKTPDWLGRRKALLLYAIITLIGGALQAGSVNIGMYLVMRFLTGIGIGALVGLVPLYQSEIAPPRIRGLLVGMHGVLICVGYSLASWIGLGFYFVNASGAQWRLPLAIQCLPPLFLSLGVLFLPESPRWLLDQNCVDEAYKSFVAVRAESDDAMLNNEHAIRAEFKLLQGQLLHEKQEELSLVSLFKLPHFRKRCLVGWLTMFGCQGTATLVINNYGPSLYASLGFSTVPQLVIQGCWITVCPFGNLLNSLVVDRFGRTRMLMVGFAGCVVALIGECATVDVFQRTGSHGSASAAVFFLFLHIAFFSACCDATSYIYAAEIFPTPVRAKGLAVSISGLFIATIVFLQAAPSAFAAIKWKYYLVFIAVTTVIFLVVWFYFPETKGRSLEDIGQVFGDSVEPLTLGMDVDNANDVDEKTTARDRVGPASGDGEGDDEVEEGVTVAPSEKY
ncbi:MFS-type transporter criB [Exophiala dermatitidis]|uniref:MFS transporter, SP family, sugar:H+ symporter n=1 Tax=Exophiala dermatitidis (strain ATCC 34100 / CBS 525.76 / NIH/UT8656) TaxID=858893 RepID=H6BQZ3_EXODN|nr:MFS transporter, SP family, sugar:H+ symporter [Exophiala dermatitidis NIH/UT8656]EHY54629.1 MFS transporter, SP family, sugar:H+ symporter [Exophiala dermatitidis NIH/UT8656]